MAAKRSSQQSDVSHCPISATWNEGVLTVSDDGALERRDRATDERVVEPPQVAHDAHDAGLPLHGGRDIWDAPAGDTAAAHFWHVLEFGRQRACADRSCSLGQGEGDVAERRVRLALYGVGGVLSRVEEMGVPCHEHGEGREFGGGEGRTPALGLGVV